MDRGDLVHGASLGDARLGAQVPPGKQASAEWSGDHNRIARPGPGAPDRARAVASPSTVTLITSGPSQALVSPPTSSTPNRPASSRTP